MREICKDGDLKGGGETIYGKRTNENIIIYTDTSRAMTLWVDRICPLCFVKTR